MVPPAVLVADIHSVAQHHPLGASTGASPALRGDWPALVRDALRTSTFAVELAALSEPELPGLIDFLASEPALPFHFVSVHAPSKGRAMPEDELVDRLAALPPSVDAIVVHPDQMLEPARYARLGSRLAIENMDARKAVGTTADDLEPFFDACPEAVFCFDVAHAWSVDPEMDEAERLLDRYAWRLRHVHVSSLDEDGHHRPLDDEQEGLFRPLLMRCRDVPWILEAPLR